MQSPFFLQPLDFEDKMNFRFKNFMYNGKKEPEIIININIVEKLPEFANTTPIFITYHFQDGSENWRLLQKGDSFIYKSPLEDKKQVMVVNKDFDRVEAYLLPKKENSVSNEKERGLVKRHKGLVWNISDIIYDFLQVLLINYLALIKKDGIFVHGMGVKSLDKDGFLFAGKSGAGKTTLAKIYHNNSQELVLNDDRIIVRKMNNNFYIYGSPWHGEFSDYLESHIERASLTSIFFLKKAKENSMKSISISKGFKYLYPAMFPTFWDYKGTQWISLFLIELLSKVDCFRLKFKKDKSVIGFVKKINC